MEILDCLEWLKLGLTGWDSRTIMTKWIISSWFGKWLIRWCFFCVGRSFVRSLAWYACHSQGGAFLCARKHAKILLVNKGADDDGNGGNQITREVSNRAEWAATRVIVNATWEKIELSLFTWNGNRNWVDGGDWWIEEGSWIPGRHWMKDYKSLCFNLFHLSLADYDDERYNIVDGHKKELMVGKSLNFERRTECVGWYARAGRREVYFGGLSGHFGRKGPLKNLNLKKNFKCRYFPSGSVATKCWVPVCPAEKLLTDQQNRHATKYSDICCPFWGACLSIPWNFIFDGFWFKGPLWQHWLTDWMDTSCFL